MTKPTQDKETLREAVARAYWSVALKNGLANDLRQWDERQWKDGEFDCFSPAVDSKTKALVLEAMDEAIATMFERLRTPGSHAIFLGVEQWCQEVDFPERDVENIWQAMLTAFQQENSDAD